MGELFAHPRIDDAPMDRVPLDGTERKKSLLAAGDLLFARQSLTLDGAGKCSIFVGDTEPVTFESHIIRARLDPQVADPDFFYYYFTSPSGRASIQSIVEQVAAAGIRGRDLAQLKVPAPPLVRQHEIARVLRCLDDKIELNRRTNRTLQSIARAIFKSWFVDFDPVRARREGGEVVLPPDLAALFPGDMEPSTIGLVPMGWRCRAVKEVAAVVRGRSYKGSELAPSTTALVTLKSFARDGRYRPEGLKEYTGSYKAEQVVEVGDVVVAHTDVTQAAEVLGRAVRVPRSREHTTLVASLDTAVVRPIDDAASREILLFSLDTERFRDFAYGHCNGTTVLHLSASALPEYPILLPPIDIGMAFTGVAGAIDRKRDALDEESRTLAMVRDALLPELLSDGFEFRVKSEAPIVEARLD